MNRINPYRRNCEIMRRFFAKPIFLITGIVLLILVIANSVFSFLSDQIPVFDFISIATGIAFLVFFFKARCKKDFVSFGAPTTLMDVVSIIGIVFSGLITAVSACLSALFILVVKNQETQHTSLENTIIDTICKISPVITILGIIFLLYFIGMLRMTLSFRKSLSTVYLQRKGSVMFGVMSLILAVVSIIYYTGLMVITFYELEEFGALLLQGINIPALVQGLLVTLIFVLYAILGFMYNSYIKKLVNSIETGRPVQTAPDKTEEVIENNPTLNMWAETEANSQTHKQAVVTRPVEFTPKAVFGDSKSDEVITIPTEYCPPQNDMQNPYLKNTAGATKHCANCGKENPNINIFCGNCGNRL
ncbi:MAG: zinc ribbon domain-containing protein [Ruminococcus sp.]